MANLFRVKPLSRLLDEMEHGEQRLKRSLGPVQLTSLGIGAIIGAGIFSTVGTAAAGGAGHLGAGPALVLSFVLTAHRLRLRRALLRRVRGDGARSRGPPTRTPTRRSASSSRGSSAGT